MKNSKKKKNKMNNLLKENKNLKNNFYKLNY